MLRRDLLKVLGAASLSTIGGTVPYSALANTSTNCVESERATLQRAFRSSFDGVAETLGPTHIKFDAPLPQGLTGTFYRNGPARMQRGDTQYKHWFDGDGMIQSFAISADRLTHRAKMVRTSRYVAEEKAGRFLWSGFGTAFADGLSVKKPDDVNVANISVLPVGDELLALWEAGSAWEIDPDTLETTGRKVLSPDTDGVPFSAHPRVDPGGRIWNFGYLSGSDKLVLYDLSPAGKLNRATVIDAPNTNMVHDFAVTERYLVFALMPITYTPMESNSANAFADLLGWDANGTVDILLIDKQQLTIAHRFELPPFFAFHFGNAWQDGNQIRLETAVAPPWDELNETIMRATMGHPQKDTFDEPPALDIILNLKTATASVEQLPHAGAEFPVYDNRFTGLKTSRLVMLARSEQMPPEVFGFNRVQSFNRKTDQLQAFDYGPHTIAEEHVFVAKSGATEGEGWLIGTSFNWKTRRTTLTILDASHLEDGAIASATLPYHLPLGLHGKFVES